jgi:hypothetical protein
VSYGQNNEEKKSVPVPVIVAACVALVGLVAWWGVRSLSGPLDPGASNPDVAKKDARWRELVKKSGGDMEKLSPEEKAQFLKEAGPYAMRIWESLKASTK